MRNAVPKIIHYCWFGDEPPSENALRAIESWKKYAPGFEIRCCDESVLDLGGISWTRDAYKAKKYAFVADYARFRMVYDYGGVYMDLGSELVRDITELVETSSPFSALEERTRTVSSGLVLAAPPHDPLIAEMLARYESAVFQDDPDFLGKHTVNHMFTRLFEERGFVQEDSLQMVGDWTILPSRAFNPVYGFCGYHIKGDTYSIHRYSASWSGPKFRTKREIQDKITPFVGRRAGEIIGRIVAEIKHNGLRSGTKNLCTVAQSSARRAKGEMMRAVKDDE